MSSREEYWELAAGVEVKMQRSIRPPWVVKYALDIQIMDMLKIFI